MKKIILCTILFAFATASFGQQVTPKQHWTETDYYKKSKNQKKAAWIMVGGGATLWLTGIIIPRGEATGLNSYYGLPGFGGKAYKNDGIKGALSLSGALSILGSIPLFIASGKNKRRANAISASLKTNNASIVRGYSLTRINYPALSLKIVLN